MNPYQHEKNSSCVVKLRKDHFMIAVIIFSTFETVALLSPFFMEKSLIPFAIVLPMFMLYICLSYFNEKMIYGDDGITFVNIWNHSEHYTWDEIVVEDTFESSHSIGNFPVRVVYIRYKNARGHMTRVRYQVNDYSGIQQFLSFYEQMQDTDDS